MSQKNRVLDRLQVPLLVTLCESEKVGSRVATTQIAEMVDMDSVNLA